MATLRRSLSFARRLDGVAIALLVVFALQAALAASSDSVTVDEFAHLPVGLYSLYTGDLSLDPINPPLTRMFAALPLLARPPAFDLRPGTNHWSLGYELMRRNASDYQSIFVSARRMIVLLALALGALVYSWSDMLYGRAAARSALLLFAFSPDLLAHGHLVTLDLAGALGFTLTAYVVWCMLERATIAGAVAVGAAFGLASLLKLSGFVLAVSVAAALFARRFDRSATPAKVTSRAWAVRVAIMAMTGLLVLNAGYLGDGSFGVLAETRLDPNGRMASIAESLPWLRMPLPRPFVEGIDMVLNVGKAREPSYFLLGELSADGWWYYHLVAFAAKTPLPLLLLFSLAISAWALGRSRGVREYCLVLPVVILFASNTLFNSLQIGVRHTLPAQPLLMILAAPWLADALKRSAESRLAKIGAVVAAAGAVWYMAGTVAVAPRYLQYFNEVAGGSGGGHEMLVDSNIDWGQDLLRLRKYMDEEDIERVDLAYFGRVDPAVYGISYVPLERNSRSSHAVVSATFLMGRPYFWFLGGMMRWVPAQNYAWLREHEPIARVGSMFVFDLR